VASLCKIMGAFNSKYMVTSPSATSDRTQSYRFSRTYSPEPGS
jgi:hypothetical protein